MKYITFAAIGNFLIYSGASFALLAVFVRSYMWFTPYDELAQMRAGKKAPVMALGGAMLGYTFPLLSLSYHGTNFIDFLIWSVVAGGAQLVLFKILYWIIPMEVEADNQAVGLFYGFAALSVGLINAFSLIPS